MDRNILLTIEYDGSKYHGWQRQAKHVTAQGELEDTIQKVLGLKERVVVRGTSRTDGGVHSVAQKATFQCPVPIPLDRIKKVVNRDLPPSIRIVGVEEKPLDFSPTKMCKSKTYVYKILLLENLSPMANDYYYQIEGADVDKILDIKKMKAGAKEIGGTHDFKAFEASGGTKRDSTVRTIYNIQVTAEKLESKMAKTFNRIEGKIVTIEITGDGFLYNMVRIIAGTLVDIGKGKKRLEQVGMIIKSKDRKKAGHTAPAGGLYLTDIKFE